MAQDNKRSNGTIEMASVAARFGSLFRKMLMRRHGAKLGKNVYVGKSVRLEARDISVGAGCYLGDHLHIIAEVIRIGDNCQFAGEISIRASSVEIGYNCVFFPGARVHSLSRFKLGAFGKISKGATLKAGHLEIGDEFWMNTGAEIGGGGWRNPDSLFRAGDRCHVGRNTHINVARAVIIGNDTAVGMDCTLVTHGHWQPITEGYSVVSGPVELGSDVAVYTRSVIGPGITIGAGSAIAAGSVVIMDVKEHVMVGGVPATILRDPIGTGGDPEVVRTIVHDYFVRFHSDTTVQRGPSWLRIDLPDWGAVMMSDCVQAFHDQKFPARIIALSFSPEAIREATKFAECAFDLKARMIYGQSSDLSESLRTMFFSFGVRFRYRDGYKRRDLDYRSLVEYGIE